MRWMMTRRRITARTGFGGSQCWGVLGLGTAFGGMSVSVLGACQAEGKFPVLEEVATGFAVAANCTAAAVHH
eukprot:5105269-Amphidinium_carterae.1